MNQELIVRAWEDPVYRASLAPEILASLPASPSGVSMNDLGEDEVRAMIGAAASPWSINRTAFMTHCCA